MLPPTATYAYDGERHRVAQSVTAGGSTTTTYYVAGLEEQANISGGASTLTKYYSVPGVLSAVSVGGTLSFLASDGLGSVSEALSATSAAATSQQLYGPYGGLRYATGNMPTAKGYTGQYADAASSGLDYYNARYYDPLTGQFASADSQADGLNRYGYVKGNPETATDPSGHRVCKDANCDGGGGGGHGSGGGADDGSGDGSGGCTTHCGRRPPPPCTSHCGGKPTKPHCRGCRASVADADAGTGDTTRPVVPDWEAIGMDVAQLLAGWTLASGGLALLAAAMANPEALLAAAELATDFGGSPVTPVFAILTMIATGVANLVHGFFGILSQFGMVNGALVQNQLTLF